MTNQAPALAHYRAIDKYKPQYGDFVVWSGWFTTWTGLVSDFDKNTGEVSVVFANVPFILLTLRDPEMPGATRKIPLSQIQGSTHGVFAVLQHNHDQNVNVWFI